MSALSSNLTYPRKFEILSVEKIIDLGKEGNCVVLHNAGKCALGYHECLIKKENQECVVSINDRWVYYVDVQNESDLWEAWKSSIKDAGHAICSCELKSRICLLEKVPNHYKMTLI